MRTIVLNNLNVVSGTNNSRYLYKFPNSVNFKDHQIAVSAVNMYYSWFSITSSIGNNSFQYVWYNNGGATTKTITIPDGFYSVADLNAYLQSQMVANGHYLLDSLGDYVYYLEFVINASTYSVQLNSYAIPTALPTGYTNPASITFPATATTPQVIIASTNTFKDIIGFDAGTYPDPVQTTTYSKTSDYTPQVSPTQSVVLSCSLLNNPYANPNTILYSFAPTGTTFGSLISSVPNELIFVDIQEGVYPDFFIEFWDQNFQKLTIQDNNVVIMLVIRKKGE